MGEPFDSMPIGWWRHPDHIRKVQLGRQSVLAKWDRIEARRECWETIKTALIVVVAIAFGSFGAYELSNLLIYLITRR